MGMASEFDSVVFGTQIRGYPGHLNGIYVAVKAVDFLGEVRIQKRSGKDLLLEQDDTAVQLSGQGQWKGFYRYIPSKGLPTSNRKSGGSQSRGAPFIWRHR